MNLKIYVVACNADPTCIVIAESKSAAESMAKTQADIDFGVCDDHWEAYEINDYFSDSYGPEFFGWVKNSGQKYI